HTHDAKLITVDANSKRVFANSGTEGMWEGALSCVEIGGDTMKVVYHLPPSDSAGKDLLSTYFHASSSQLLDDSEVIETKSTS
ncbi:MAG: hypothetical protein HY074_16780, partial [Deltaproteobacteria bacterium]|nr:hypothetical protein [Deltaproteobacteria bacterium]